MWSRRNHITSYNLYNLDASGRLLIVSDQFSRIITFSKSHYHGNDWCFLVRLPLLLSMESRITRKGNSYAKRKHIFFYKRVCFLCVFSWWVAWGLGNFLLLEMFLTLSFERGMIGPSSEGVAAAWRDSQHTGFGTVHSKPGLPWNSETHVHSFTVHGGLFFCVLKRWLVDWWLVARP